MAADLDVLIPEFRGKVQALIANCARRGMEMRPSDTLRAPFDQAKLWRQSRSREEINSKIGDFKAAGADFLAHCLESVGPQRGAPVTNAPPGFSWHQWGEALDCFWVVEGRSEWSTSEKVNGENGFRVYAEEAEKLGLSAGGNWSGFKDWPHVQLRATSSPDKVMSLKDINDEMRRRFG